MKNPVLPLSMAAVGLMLAACAVRVPSVTTPAPDYYGNIEQTMVINGFPKKSAPWVVYSDRDKNTAFLKKDKNESPKEMTFMEPLLVLDHHRGKRLVKVAAYSPDALLQKTPARALKSYGWLPEDQLLLWTNALGERSSGFTLKAAVVPGNGDVIRNSAAYLQSDSAVVYSSPNFTQPRKKKVGIGQLVYVYKKSDDNRGYLIGHKPKLSLDSAEAGVHGWISSHMIAPWGERSAIRLDGRYSYQDSTGLGIYNRQTDYSDEPPAVSLSDAMDRSVIENIFPVSLATESNATKYFTNLFDYSQNEIYNVLGQKLSYTRYREITSRSKKLNLVFAVDVSAQNRAHAPLAKSIMQDLQRRITNLAYYNSVKYSVVLYKDNPCGANVFASVLSDDMEGLFRYMDEKTGEMQCDRAVGQPVNEALGTAGELLGTVPDETNVIVLIGATAASGSSTANATRLISGARAKLLVFQTEARPADMYNNFVLLAENTVTATSRNIAELNKEKTADHSFIKNRNNFSLVEGEQGVYSLDYPAKSMTQGFVLYPKRRETNNNALLMQALDTLLTQLTHENIQTKQSLLSYFKTEAGSNKTVLHGRHSYKFSGAPVPLPASVSAQLIGYNYPMLVPGYIPVELRTSAAAQKGILISETEYENLRKMYSEIYRRTAPDTKDFRQSRAVSKFVQVITEYAPTIEGLSAADLYAKPMSFAVARSTGLDVSDDPLMNQLTVADWKNKKKVSPEVARAYFKNYRQLADRLLENTNNPKIKIKQNGTVFYWLSDYFMPGAEPNSVL